MQSLRRRWLLAAVLLAGIVLVSLALVAYGQTGSGDEALTPQEQQQALDLALHAPLPHAVDVTGHIPPGGPIAQGVTLASLLEGKRFLPVNAFRAPVPANKEQHRQVCAKHRCAQAQLYNFTDRTTLVALVDLTDRRLIEVQTLPGAAPGVNETLQKQVLQLIDQDPRVQAMLAGRGYKVTMGPAPVRRDSGPCAKSWCVLLSLGVEGVSDPQEALLVLVDLEHRRVEDVFWRSRMRR